MSYSPDEPVWLLLNYNPKKVGTWVYTQWEAYIHGGTVAENLENGIRPDVLIWDVKHGRVRVGGPEPEEQAGPPEKLPPEPSEDEPHGYVWYMNQRRRVPLTETEDGLLARDGTYDLFVSKEVKRSYGWLPVEGRTVLDVGANVGYFSALALRGGASSVVGYEPDPHAFQLALQNAADADLRMAALVWEPTGDEKLWVAPSGRNSGNSSLRKALGRTSFPILTEPWGEVLDEVRPDSIKLDCEGSEYDLLREPLPDYVTAVVMELHLSTPEWRDEARRVRDMFKGWETIVEPVLETGAWTALGGWRRG